MILYLTRRNQIIEYVSTSGNGTINFRFAPYQIGHMTVAEFQAHVEKGHIVRIG
jgi:hypothetical protein